MTWTAESRATEVREYVQSRGWSTRLRNSWVQTRTCPICRGGKHRDEWTFALNTNTAAGVCQRGTCGWKGTLTQLKAQLGDLVEGFTPAQQTAPPPDPDRWQNDHVALLGDEINLRRLEEHRGLSRDTLVAWGIGLRLKAEANDHTLVFTYFGPNDRLAYCKLKRRTSEGGKDVWREPKGQPRSYLFGAQRLTGTERVVVVEGEEDAMLLSQHGVENVVSVPDGAKISASERSKPWLDRLESFAEIVVCLDNDAPGKEGGAALASLMGEERCLLVDYPECAEAKDVTDFWRAGKLNELIEAIHDAKGKPHPLVVSAGSSEIAARIREQHEDTNPHGLSTGWSGVDELLGGMRPAELTILTAHTGAGKSAWVVNLLAQLATAKTPVIGASFELSTEDYIWRFLQKLTGRFPWARPGSPAIAMTPQERDEGLGRLAAMPLRVIQHFGQMGVGQFEEAVRFAVRRLGVKVAVLDHIHFMLVGAGDEERHVLTDAMYRLKNLAKELGISVVVVAHPSRAARGKASPDLTDLHGSASLEQIADNVVTLQRLMDAETASRGRAVFAVKKLRCGRSGRLGSCELEFERAAESFVDSVAIEVEADDDQGFAKAF